MNIEELRDHCLAIKNAEEPTPFGEEVMVYKIMNKIFVFFSLHLKEAEYFVVLKCAPNRTVESFRNTEVFLKDSMLETV